MSRSPANDPAQETAANTPQSCCLLSHPVVLIIAFQNSGLSHSHRKNKIAASMLHAGASALQLSPRSESESSAARAIRAIAFALHRLPFERTRPVAYGVDCSNIITITVRTCATVLGARNTGNICVARLNVFLRRD